MADEAGQERVFDRRGRKEAVIGSVNNSICAVNVIRKPDTGTELDTGPHQLKVIIAGTDIYPEIRKWRKVVLQVYAGLATVLSAAEGRKDVRVATAIEEKALGLAQAEQVKTAFKNVAVPEVGQVTLESYGQRAARSD